LFLCMNVCMYTVLRFQLIRSWRRQKIRTNEHLQNLLDKGILKSPEENGFREEPLPSFRAPLQKEIRSDLKGNVHERFENLIALIDSLSRVHGIEDTLLVFSHDVFLDEINSLVANIGFAPVLQIFYPYSIQIYNSSFPAQDPRDCPRTLTK
uniref:DNA helicase n=1 Tax=Schistocephalus solidus TaxID=70667 RepID=A0A183SS27_SCHSO